MPKYEAVASQFCEAIRTLAENPDNLCNLESYLSYHFPEWMRKYASTPAELTTELQQFAGMILY